MSKLSRTQLKTKNNNLIKENFNQEITGPIHNEINEDFIDSFHTDADAYTKAQVDSLIGSTTIGELLDVEFLGLENYNVLSYNAGVWSNENIDDRYYRKDEVYNSGETLTATEIEDTFYKKTGGLIDGTVTISGNLTVQGTETIVNTDNLYVKDNLILLNSGETGTGVSAVRAGVQIDRGTLDDYLFIFDELSGWFRVGQSGETQAVATREDSPTNNSIMIWDGTENKLVSSDITNISTDYTLTGNDTSIWTTGAIQDYVGAEITSLNISNYYNKTESDNRYVELAGDTMTGSLSLGSSLFFTAGNQRIHSTINGLVINYNQGGNLNYFGGGTATLFQLNTSGQMILNGTQPVNSISNNSADAANVNELWTTSAIQDYVGNEITSLNISNYYNKTESDDRYLLKSNNLSDLTNTTTARSNLGLGSMATQDSIYYYNKTETDNRYVEVAGDTMTGSLNIDGRLDVNNSLLSYIDLNTSTNDARWQCGANSSSIGSNDSNIEFIARENLSPSISGNAGYLQLNGNTIINGIVETSILTAYDVYDTDTTSTGVFYYGIDSNYTSSMGGDERAYRKINLYETGDKKINIVYGGLNSAGGVFPSNKKIEFEIPIEAHNTMNLNIYSGSNSIIWLYEDFGTREVVDGDRFIFYFYIHSNEIYANWVKTH